MGAKEREERHKEFVKDFILSYLKAGYTRLSEITEQTAMSPLSEIGREELEQFLDKHGYKLVEVKDYLIVRK